MLSLGVAGMVCQGSIRQVKLRQGGAGKVSRVKFRQGLSWFNIYSKGVNAWYTIGEQGHV